MKKKFGPEQLASRPCTGELIVGWVALWAVREWNKVRKGSGWPGRAHLEFNSNLNFDDFYLQK
jgi:hypothetical protein